MFRTLVLAAALGSWTLPALAQDWAKQKLEKSPRHGEYVDIKNGDRTLHAFVVYPEVSQKATAVIVIHEIFGLTDWAKLAADEFAAAGYIAIAPDMISGAEAGTDARRAISKLPPAQVISDLTAAQNYVKSLPAANGKVAVAGFCWGGGKSFDFAAHGKDLAAAFVFYGVAPKKEAMAKIACPVYGFYAQNDARITTTVPQTEKSMQVAGKQYQVVTYPGAGHGFMRAGEAPDASEPNHEARDAAWKRLKEVLAKL
jgi:carboxymethylenebutenolidase